MQSRQGIVLHTLLAVRQFIRDKAAQFGSVVTVGSMQKLDDIIAKLQAIVAEQAADFRDWMAALRVVPAITSLRDHAERIRAAELRRMEPRWDSLTAADRERLDAVTRGMLNKLLHQPTVRLKQLAAADQSAPYAEAVTELFGLAAHPAKPE